MSKATKKPRRRRTPEERIRDLEREIARIREAKKFKSSPALKKARSGLRTLRKAQELVKSEENQALEQALGAAVAALEPCFAEADSTGGRGRLRRSAADLAAVGEGILVFLKENPRSTIGAIAKSLEMTPKEVRSPLAGLLEDGQVEKEGERGGTTYRVARRRARKG